eukprot:13840359-Alexandrium_andersonii.AAC.1
MPHARKKPSGRPGPSSASASAPSSRRHAHAMPVLPVSAASGPRRRINSKQKPGPGDAFFKWLPKLKKKHTVAARKHLNSSQKVHPE